MVSVMSSSPMGGNFIFLRHLHVNFVQKWQKCQIFVIYENLECPFWTLTPDLFRLVHPLPSPGPVGKRTVGLRLRYLYSQFVYLSDARWNMIDGHKGENHTFPVLSKKTLQSLNQLKPIRTCSVVALRAHCHLESTLRQKFKSSSLDCGS